jgi:hypothetical protein
VIVRDTQKPTAALDAPREVDLGRSFQLFATRSSDIAPGRIIKVYMNAVGLNSKRLSNQNGRRWSSGVD